MNFLPNYISVGIDVAADFSWFCILTPDGKEFKKPFKVEHDNADSLKNAVLTIKKAEEQFSMKSKIFLESTGIYHFPLFCHLKELGFEVFVINPLITNSNKNIGIRKVKNDRFDAKRIAAIGYSPDTKLSVMPTELILNLRCLCREYYSLADNRTSYVNKLKAQLHIVFPGFCKVFSDITGITAISVLKRFPTPEDVINAQPDEIIELISLLSRKGLNYAKAKYDKLFKSAKNALNFRYNLSSVYDVLKMYIYFIEEFDKKINLILSAIKAFVDKNKSEKFVQQIYYLDSIPGVGFLSAVTLMCEIGDFSAFSKPKQLFAYFGVDPSVNESGHFKGTDNKMSKRGSKIARRVLYAIALASVRVKRNDIAINPVLYDYYQKKKESKPKKVALGAIMHKISDIVFAVLRDNKPFVLKTPDEHKLQYQNIHKAA
ncbi:IS110 family transposase [Thermoanaerobacterium sp. RBIITD]|uniref:IS110 family transposase n=1 Tax=Thermoanaerobacterium sp. RBIITD TaxID=1550240 RepID=UPI000BB89FA7|nr:IS110 family transposase [Thermoanaerobacterium sp. RBIITD]SNX53889.1 Transposase [Thermoanaerobacterium sp. RBIITD]